MGLHGAEFVYFINQMSSANPLERFHFIVMLTPTRTSVELRLYPNGNFENNQPGYTQLGYIVPSEQQLATIVQHLCGLNVRRTIIRED